MVIELLARRGISRPRKAAGESDCLFEPTHPQPLQGGEPGKTHRQRSSPPGRSQGWVAPRATAAFLEADLVVALAILVIALLPLAYSFVSDQRALRAAYERAAAMQMVDGEMEVLVAGGWRHYPPGTNRITFTGNAAANLTTNRALLIIETNSIRLEWRTARRVSTGIIREAKRP